MEHPRRLPDAAPFDRSPEELRRLGERLIELMIEAIGAETEDPVLRTIDGPSSRALLDEPLPEEGVAMDHIMDLWQKKILPYCRRNGHPRFFGYVCTSADPLGMLADGFASALNQPVTAWRSSPGATEVERLAVRWLDQLVGFQGGGGGLLVSGGSAANFHGLAAGVRASEEQAGLGIEGRHRLGVYLSKEGHVSLRKALALLGIPDGNVRLLGIDGQRRMRPDELREAIVSDRNAGRVPALVAGSSGTANTGAIDPLDALAEIASDEGLWFHVDGAYGAPAAATPEYAWMRTAFERADSLSLDPHKWLFAPADAGCILVRDENALRRAFMIGSEYTHVTQTEPIERYAFFDHGLEMSRRFRGLKVWTLLKARGARLLREAIGHDIAMRRYLDERIRSEPRLEPLGSELSISCFRFVGRGSRSVETLNELNRVILETLVREGRCFMSPTRLEGRYALRVCIVNFRTRERDIDLLVDEILRIGSGAEPSN